MDFIAAIKMKNWFDHASAMGLVGFILSLLFGNKE